MAFKRNKLTTTKWQYAGLWIFVGIMLIYTFMLFYPFIWSFVCSFMPQSEFFGKIGQVFPSVDNFSLDNYREALAVVVQTIDKNGNIVYFDIPAMIGNTIFMTIVRTVLGTIPPLISAYCCAKYRFWGNKFFFFYGVVFGSIPFYGGTASVFRLLNMTGLYNTIWGIMFLSIGSYGGFLFYYSFFKGIDWTYAEAAFIDGASHFKVFLHIMFPHIVPILLVFLVGGFFGNWNDWMTNYMYLPSQPMIAFGVYQISSLATVRGNWTLLFAAVFLSISVPLGVFFIFRKKILSVAYTGGLKG